MRFLAGLSVFLLLTAIAWLFFQSPKPDTERALGVETKSNTTLSTKAGENDSMQELARTPSHGEPEAVLPTSTPEPARILKTASEASRVTPLLVEALGGVFKSRSMLQEALLHTSGELALTPDLEYWDEEVTAFPIKSDLRAKAHLLVNRESFERDGKTLKGYQIRIEDETPHEFWSVEGLVRRDPRMDVVLVRDEKGDVDHVMMSTQIPVALSICRDLGIDAYHGTYPEGVVYSKSLSSNSFVLKMIGIINGRVVQPKDFPGLPVVDADGDLDLELLQELNRKISAMIQKLESAKVSK